MVGVGVIIAVGVGLFYYSQPENGIPAPSCTEDAKLCSDGSYVGRTGPNCEFVCPQTSTPVVRTNVPAKLGEKVLFGNTYITPLEVLEDSRCPDNVQCVQAGRLVFRAKLERNGKTQESVFDSTKSNSVIFDGSTFDFEETQGEGITLYFTQIGTH